jgi:aldose 1-epimerase
MTDGALETLHLRDRSSTLEAEFVPTANMLCRSLRHRGEELLAQNAGFDAYARLGKTMGIPLLYPWANRLAGFDYRAGGRSVRIPHDPASVHCDARGLPIHGVIGGRLAWEPIEESARPAGGDPDSPAARLEDSAVAPLDDALAARLDWSDAHPDLFELFPFRHELRYDARLHDGSLRIDVTVHACGADAVPLAFGFHPYLSPPGSARERWSIELPEMRALALDAQQIPTGPAEAGARAAARFELDARELDDGFDALAEPARFSVLAAGRLIELTFTRGYQCAQVFAPAGKQFICFEPMTAPANALRSGEGLRLLAPGERFTASFVLAVRESP